MPRKQCHTFVRSRGKRVLTAETVMVKLFDYTQKREKGWEEWQFITVNQARIAEMVDAGEAEPVRRFQNGWAIVVGYRALTPTRALKRSACTLTLETMDAVGKRATGGGLDWFEQKDVDKFDVWALVGTMRGGGVRPRISDADRIRAGRLLGERWLPIGATFEPGLAQAA